MLARIVASSLRNLLQPAITDCPSRMTGPRAYYKVGLRIELAVICRPELYSVAAARFDAASHAARKVAANFKHIRVSNAGSKGPCAFPLKGCLPTLAVAN